MNRARTIIILGLFAVAALEFGIFGVSASGLTGSGGSALPPIGQRLGVATETPPPADTPTPGDVPQLSPPSVVAGITLIADPLAINCDGSQTSHVRVRILDVNGDPAPDGIPVSFEPYNGDASPYSAQTLDGYAETDVRFYDEIFPPGPNLVVRADLLEAGIRVLCFPRSDECPLSPPSDGEPCGETPTPTPSSPPVCDISPPTDPLSPPCATPTPECAISPPSASPPSLSPPCGPSSDIEFAIDCDLAQPDVQGYCAVAAGTNVDVGIVLTNRSSIDHALSAFNFVVDNQDENALSPLQGVDANRDGNPDFNQDLIAGPGWQCSPPPPNPDTVAADGRTTSLLSCFNTQEPAHPLPAGQSVLLATVHYASDPNAEYAYTYLSLLDASAFDENFSELGSCNPYIQIEMACSGASVDIYQPAGPSDFDLQVDCDVATPGIQQQCTAPADAAAFDADLYVLNTGGEDVTLGGFGFTLRNSDTSRLLPAQGADYNLNANPDFTAVAEPNTWICLPPIPNPDTGQYGPAESASQIGCYDYVGIVPAVVPAGGTLRVATVHYRIPQDAQPGSVTLSLPTGYVSTMYDGMYSTCEDIVYNPDILCAPSTLTLVDAATATPSPTPTRTATPTATATPGPRCADIDGDGRVRFDDVLAVARAVLAGNYADRFDINRDGALTSADVAAAVAQLRKRC